MRISDWSSDVCSSDLATGPPRAARRRTPATATRWQPAGTCPGIRRRRRWLLVVGLDGVVGGELPVLQPGELLDRRVILRDHRPALFIGQSGALPHPLRILVVFSGQQSGRAHGCTQVTTAITACRIMLEKKK